MQNVEVLWAARYDYNPKWVLKEHQHDYYQMIYVMEGKAEINLESKTQPLGKGDLIFITPKQAHGMEIDKNIPLKTMDIKFLVLDSELADSLSKVDNVLSMDNADIKRLFKSIHEEGKGKKSFYSELGNIYLLQILIALLRYHEDKFSNSQKEIEGTEVQGYDEICEKVIAFIKAHYNEDVTLKDIANSIGYNQSYICQNFKKNFGASPIKHLYIYRLEKAKELITYSEFSLKQIALMTGFKSIHHFTRLFHQVQGLSPGQWRDSEKEAIRRDIYFNGNFVNQIYTEKT